MSVNIIAASLRSSGIGEKIVEQVAIPWHFGFVGLATGDSANILTDAVGDANTHIPEYKAFMCNIEKGGTKA